MKTRALKLQISTALYDRLAEMAEVYSRPIDIEIEERLVHSFDIIDAKDTIDLMITDPASRLDRLALAPGDFIVFKSNRSVTLDQMKELRQRLEEIFGNEHKILMLMDECDIAAYTRDQVSKLRSRLLAECERVLRSIT
jgi:hypothetical protein